MGEPPGAGGCQSRMKVFGSSASAVAVMLAVAACSGDPDAVAPTGAPFPGPSRPGLDCANPIDSLDEPPAGYTVLLDAVALTAKGPLQAERMPDGRYFAKTGLLIRTGREAELVVPADRAEVDWGNTGTGVRTSRFRIPACPRFGAGDWQVYPGGYHVTAPVCLPVEIRAGGRTATVDVPVGVSCPAGGAAPGTSGS
jgi:hypothetical protein